MLSENLIRELGLTREVKNCYYKKVDFVTPMYNSCTIYFINETLLSIIIERDDRDSKKVLVSLLECSTDVCFLDIISRLPLLQHIFPSLVKPFIAKLEINHN